MLISEQELLRVFENFPVIERKLTLTPVRNPCRSSRIIASVWLEGGRASDIDNRACVSAWISRRIRIDAEQVQILGDQTGFLR